MDHRRDRKLSVSLLRFFVRRFNRDVADHLLTILDNKMKHFSSLQSTEYILILDNDSWTLPSNTALTVGPKLIML
jgi:hypothetical protein